MNRQVVTVANLPKRGTQGQLSPAASLLAKQPIRVRRENLTRRHQGEPRRDHHQKYSIISRVSYSQSNSLVDRMGNIETNQNLQLDRRSKSLRILHRK